MAMTEKEIDNAVRTLGAHRTFLHDAMDATVALDRASSSWLAKIQRKPPVSRLAVQNRRLGEIRDATRATDALKQANERAERLATVAGLGTGLTERTAGITAAGTRAATFMGVENRRKEAEDARGGLLKMGVETGSLNAVNGRILKMAQDSNQYHRDLVPALKLLTDGGMSFTDAMAGLPAIARAATAEKADLTVLTGAATALRRDLGVLPADFQKSMGIIAASGKDGGIELEQMSKLLPTMTNNAEALGMKGTAAVSQMSAALQVMYHDTGDAEGAAKGLNSVLGSLASPANLTKLNKAGIDPAAIAGAADPIQALLEAVRKNPSAAGEALGAEAMSALRPLLSRVDEYRKRRDEALGGAGAIETDFAKRIRSSSEQMKQLQINAQAVAMPTLDEPFSLFDGWLTKLNQHPLWTRMMTHGAVAAESVGSALASVGSAAAGVEPVLNGYSRVTTGAARFRAAFHGQTGGDVKGWAGALGTRARSVVGGVRDWNTRAKGSVARARTALGDAPANLGSWIGTSVSAIPGKVTAAGTAIKNFSKATWSAISTKQGWKNTLDTVTGTLGKYWTSLRNVRVGKILTATATHVVKAATWLWNASLLANPITWVALAVGAAAFLIYKYWKPISGFFRGLWRGFTQAMAPVMPAVKKVGAVFAPVLKPVVALIQPIVEWFKNLLKPVDDVGGAAENLGVRWGKALAGMVQGVVDGITSIVAWFKGLPDRIGETIDRIREMVSWIPGIGKDAEVAVKPHPAVAGARTNPAAMVARADATATATPPPPLPPPTRNPLAELHPSFRGLEWDKPLPGRIQVSRSTPYPAPKPVPVEVAPARLAPVRSGSTAMRTLTPPLPPPTRNPLAEMHPSFRGLEWDKPLPGPIRVSRSTPYPAPKPVPVEVAPARLAPVRSGSTATRTLTPPLPPPTRNPFAELHPRFRGTAGLTPLPPIRQSVPRQNYGVSTAAAAPRLSTAVRVPGVVKGPPAGSQIRERVVVERSAPAQITLNMTLPPGTAQDAAEQARRAVRAATPELVRMIERTMDEREHRRARTSYQRAG